MESEIRIAGTTNPARCFAWRQPPYEYEQEKLPIDILAGSDALRSQIEAGTDPASLLTVETDVRLEGSVAALADRVFAEWGQVDLLCNNAGIAVTQPFDEAPLARHQRLIDVNLRGLVNGCHLAFAYLKQTPGARVVNLCSASALYGQPMLSTYAATKAAVRSLTEALNIEWRPHGVGVVDVLPLFVQTAMVEQEVRKMKTVQTLGVRLTADDVAATVWRLAQGPADRLPVHTPVGWQTKFFYVLAKLSPDAMNRLVTARMAGL